MTERQILPYAGEPSVQAILEQFHGSPIADIFDDFLEGDTISAAQLHKLLDNRLNGHRQLVIVEQQKTARRSVNMRVWPQRYFRPGFYGEFNYDHGLNEEALPLAQSLRKTVAQLVPTVSELNTIEVKLTPVVKRDRQIILHAHREQRYLVEPRKSREVATVEKEQYMLFERGNTAKWQQRSILPFYSVKRFADDPDVLDEQNYDVACAEEDALAAEVEALERANPEHALDISNAYQNQLEELEDKQLLTYPEPLECLVSVRKEPYAVETFDSMISEKEDSPIYKTTISFTVYATLPETLTFPAPTLENSH